MICVEDEDRDVGSKVGVGCGYLPIACVSAAGGSDVGPIKRDIRAAGPSIAAEKDSRKVKLSVIWITSVWTLEKSSIAVEKGLSKAVRSTVNSFSTFYFCE